MRACTRTDLRENGTLSNVLKLVCRLNRDKLVHLAYLDMPHRIPGLTELGASVSAHVEPRCGDPAKCRRKISRSGTRAGAPNEEQAHVARVTPLRFHDA